MLILGRYFSMIVHITRVKGAPTWTLSMALVGSA
jgi:hypothetical protein